MQNVRMAVGPYRRAGAGIGSRGTTCSAGEEGSVSDPNASNEFTARSATIVEAVSRDQIRANLLDSKVKPALTRPSPER